MTTYYSQNKESILKKLKLKRSSMDYNERQKIRNYNKQYYNKNKYKRNITINNTPIEICKKTIILNFN